MVKTRVITALMMLSVVAGLVFFANVYVWLAAVSAMLAWAAVEWANLAKFSKLAKAAYAFLLPASLGGGYALFLQNTPELMGLWVLTAVGFWLLIVPLWLYYGWRVTSKPVLAVVGALILLATGWCLLLVRPTAEQAWVLLGLLMVIWVADSVAFFAGRAFGKHKLAPSISPGKTIEGAVGAWLGVAVYLGFVTFGLTWLSQSFAFFENWHGLPIALSIPKLLLLAFILTYVSILGDLFESWLKRCAGVKDSGSALPGHGGILDRIDAILSTLPVQLILFRLMAGF